ncbi:MAG: DNA polymerase III subunit epsilon [Gammaproteobacteria bacterium]|nr:DNA polymerase III subunit epsilon [Gammaproteobacteria bacterium]
MRQIVLDTETTGISTKLGHRIIEIGAVEIIDRRLTGNTYHQYINPEREVEEEAYQVHGISDEFLSTKPVFSQVVEEFIDYIKGSQLVIHNAPFDVGFMDHEFSLVSRLKKKTKDLCGVLDTLVLAKEMRPGQKNNLDALCRAYGIDNSNRELHGALLDAELLAEVYLAMTGGQVSLTFEESGKQQKGDKIIRLGSDREKSRIIKASEQELAQHQKLLQLIEKKSGKDVSGFW